MNRTLYCILCGQRQCSESNIHFFKVPKDENQRARWMDSCGRSFAIGTFICSKHFPPEDIGRKKLRKGALPSVCFSQAITTPIPDMIPNVPSNSSCEFNEDFCDTLFKLIMSGKIVIRLPPNWGFHKLTKHILLSKIIMDDGSVKIDRFVTITESDIQARIHNKIIKVENTMRTDRDLQEFINKMNNYNVCEGSSKSCAVLLPENVKLCNSCSGYKHFLKKKENARKQKTLLITKKKTRYFYFKQRNRRLTNIIENLKKEKVDSSKIDNYIKDLPKPQQEMIKACCRAGKCKKKGIRYTLDWVYSCILMKIKSTKLYNHMRDNNILPLPSPCTLSRYIRNIDGGFGFKNEVFSLMKEKCNHLQEWQKHGCLLIDECKITETKKFDKNTMEMVGFVDLGDHTSEEMQNQLGNHALVFMFQPFAGHGLQALACFLSGGNISGELQTKLVLECILLCENAGLYIDVVTSDGATWNRKMWNHLGINNSLQPWCEHPVDSSRKLRMCSDFPHLIKCLRNNLVKRRTFQIPEGIVNYSHFEQLFEYESTKEFKICFKWTRSHLHPKQGEKMCTRLAFQLFSNTTALGLEAYKNKIDFIGNVDPSIIFCKKIDKLIDIMNSRSADTGLKYNSKEYKELEDFLIYIDLWEQCSPKEMFPSDSTAEGLKATVSCTLDLSKYLNDIGFKYLMTTRINQDHLEHFFGMMRAAGGCNTHPESLQVGQIFRLMSLFSLIKPPRGSNVTGGEMMKSLINIGDLKEKRKQITFDIELSENLAEVTEVFTDVEEAFAYFCGYVAKKMKSTTTCKECIISIIGEGNEKFNQFIKNKSRGYLTFPSKTIIAFLHEVESNISEIFEKDLTRNCLSLILERFSNFMPKILIGCKEHRFEMSKNTLRTYVVSRLSICCAKEQKRRHSLNKSKHLSKLARLQ